MRTHADSPVEPATAVCAATYYADLIPACAFVFRLTATDTRFTVYAQTEDHCRLSEDYTLLLAPRNAAPLAVSVEHAESLASPPANAARRWGEARTETDAGADRPRQRRPLGPGPVAREPSRAHARHLFADEVGRIEHLDGRLDEHVDAVRSARRDGAPS